MGVGLRIVTNQSEITALWRKLGIPASGSPETYGPTEKVGYHIKVCFRRGSDRFDSRTF